MTCGRSAGVELLPMAIMISTVMGTPAKVKLFTMAMNLASSAVAVTRRMSPSTRVCKSMSALGDLNLHSRAMYTFRMRTGDFFLRVARRSRKPLSDATPPSSFEAAFDWRQPVTLSWTEEVPSLAGPRGATRDAIEFGGWYGRLAEDARGVGPEVRAIVLRWWLRQAQFVPGELLYVMTLLARRPAVLKHS